MSGVQKAGLVVMLVAVLLIVGAWWSYRGTMKEFAVLERAPGKVVREEPIKENNSPRTWPVVQFRTAQGRTIEFISRSVHREGTEVEVAYDPNAPDHAFIYDWFGEYLATLIVGLVGAVALAIGAAMIVLGKD